jgi:hypothetical protein
MKFIFSLVGALRAFAIHLAGREGPASRQQRIKSAHNLVRHTVRLLFERVVNPSNGKLSLHGK